MTVITHVVGNLALIGTHGTNSSNPALTTINGFPHIVDSTPNTINAVVNPANRNLDIGGGVTGALVSAVQGPISWRQMTSNAKYIDNQQCVTPINVGDAVYTPCYQYINNIKHIIHTLGPVCGNDNMNMVTSCIINILQLCEFLHVENLYLPAISGGIFAQGNPSWPRQIRQLIFTTINQYLAQHPIQCLKHIYIVSYDSNDYQLWN